MLAFGAPLEHAVPLVVAVLVEQVAVDDLFGEGGLSADVVVHFGDPVFGDDEGLEVVVFSLLVLVRVVGHFVQHLKILEDFFDRLVDLVRASILPLTTTSGLAFASPRSTHADGN